LSAWLFDDDVSSDVVVCRAIKHCQTNMNHRFGEPSCRISWCESRSDHSVVRPVERLSSAACVKFPVKLFAVISSLLNQYPTHSVGERKCGAGRGGVGRGNTCVSSNIKENFVF